MRTITATLLALAASSQAAKLPSCQAASQPQAQPLDVNVSLRHDSKYVTEGRDNLSEGGLRTALVQASERGVTMLASIAEGTEADYEEINYGIEWAFVGQSYQGYLGYTRLEFEQNSGDSTDSETTFGLSTLGTIITLAADATYSKQAKGYFVELSARKDWAFKSTTVYALAVAGIDHDYASKHHGENHYQLNLGGIVPLNEFYSLEAIASRSFAGNGVEADGLGDQDFWSVILHYQP